MLNLIQKKKAELFSLKNDNLEGEFKLIVEQNHQYVSELEYQTKQTENLVFENEKLRQNLIALKNDLAIHKNIENELAERTYFSNKIIKKLKTEIINSKVQINKAKSLIKYFEDKEKKILKENKENSDVSNKEKDLKVQKEKKELQMEKLENMVKQYSNKN